MLKLLVILFMIKLYARINIYISFNVLMFALLTCRTRKRRRQRWLGVCLGYLRISLIA